MARENAAQLPCVLLLERREEVVREDVVVGCVHEFVCLHIRAWCYKVTTAKGLRWVCWLRGPGAWGRVICVSGPGNKNKPTEHEIKVAGVDSTDN